MTILQYSGSNFTLAGFASIGPWIVLILIFVSLSLLIITLYLNSQKNDDDNNRTKAAINKTKAFGGKGRFVDKAEHRRPWVGAGNHKVKPKISSLTKPKHKKTKIFPFLFGK